MEAPRVVSVYPSEGRELEVLDALPRAGPGRARACGPADEFGLVPTVDSLSESIVIAVADGSDRWRRSDLGEAFTIAN